MEIIAQIFNEDYAIKSSQHFKKPKGIILKHCLKK